jgi:hypothetical protein
MRTRNLLFACLFLVIGFFLMTSCIKKTQIMDRQAMGLIGKPVNTGRIVALEREAEIAMAEGKVKRAERKQAKADKLRTRPKKFKSFEALRQGFLAKQTLVESRKTLWREDLENVGFRFRGVKNVLCIRGSDAFPKMEMKVSNIEEMEQALVDRTLLSICRIYFVKTRGEKLKFHFNSNKASTKDERYWIGEVIFRDVMDGNKKRQRVVAMYVGVEGEKDTSHPTSSFGGDMFDSFLNKLKSEAMKPRGF